MKYGEVQAVVQLAVGLNIGIFVLKDLAVPYLQRQREDLADLSIFMGQIIDQIDSMPEGREKDTKTNQVNYLLGRMIRLLPRSSDVRRGLDRWISFMAWVAAAVTVVSFVLLFLTAKWYGDDISDDKFYGLIILFAPLILTALVMYLARMFGKGIVKEQYAIRAELAEIV